MLEDENVIVLELTEEEAQELEKLEDEIVIEENIWLEGASKKDKNKKSENKKRKDKEKEEVEETAIETEESGVAEAAEAIREVLESQWNRKAVNAEGILTQQDGAIKVAVLDSGVDITEDIDIAERVDLINEDAMSYLCADMTGHGTAVASIIGAKDNEIGTTGLNSGLEIYSVKILDEENRAPLSRVLAALQWCQENDIDVVNMSFGTTTYSQILQKAIEDAEKQGMLLVASVGNGDTVEYPAAFEEVVGVASVDSELNFDEDCASGEGVELVAPGKYVPITAELGCATIGSGSSYAAPHVTAIAATLWNEVPDWDSRKIRALLAAGAKEISVDGGSGYGLVDYAYTQSIMGEFSQNYVENKREILIEEYENDTTLECYDMPEYVEANWADKGHNALIDYAASGTDTWQTAYSKNKLSVLKEVSLWLDRDLPSEVNALHARKDTNYVGVTKYLYEVALAQKKSPDKKMAKIISAVGKPAYLSDAVYSKITSMITEVCDAAMTTVSYSSNQEGMNRAMRVLGMAIHVATDAYAHKAMVPNTPEAINYIKTNGLYGNKWKDIMDEIKKNELTTAALGNYCGGNDNSNVTYPDCINFLPKRYKYGARHATKRLMRDFYEKKVFNFTTFYHKENTIKQYRLLTYVTKANDGVAPAGVTWADISACDPK